MTSLGPKLQAIPKKLLPKFGSRVLWRRRVLTEDPATGIVTEGTPTEYPNLDAFVAGPRRVRFDGAETVTLVDQVIFLPETELPWAADGTTGERGVNFEDEVEIQSGLPMRVLEVRTSFAPGGTGAPLVVGHFVFLVN